MNWEGLDKVELPTGAISSTCRVCRSDLSSRVSYCLLRCFVRRAAATEAHTQTGNDYTETHSRGFACGCRGPPGVMLVASVLAWLTEVQGRWLAGPIGATVALYDLLPASGPRLSWVSTVRPYAGDS